MPKIEVRHLSKQYGTFFALNDASFTFEGTGAIGYLGPNGAGKTTTLKLLTHLSYPTAGHAYINGHDVAAEPKQALWDVGSVIESPEPYPWQTGEQTLKMVADFRGIPPAKANAKVKELVADLDLPPLSKKTGALSKGQRQRIVIAAALLSDPSIIILDEPTSGLDPAERVAIRNILLRLKKERLILMSSHLLNEVVEVCDRAVFINHGRILLNDTVAAITERQVGTEVEVEFAQPTTPDQLGAIAPLVRAVRAVTPTRVHISFDGKREKRVELVRMCVQLGPVLSFESAQLSLEEAYLELMGTTSQQQMPNGSR